jgi:hypothetical protein
VAAANKRAGFHADDAEILGLGEGEVEAALGLDDFALADFAGGVADLAADVDAVEIGGQGERVGKGVAEQDGERVAPFGVGGGHHAAGVRAVDDVVMDQRGHVDEFEDDAEFQTWSSVTPPAAPPTRMASAGRMRLPEVLQM